MNLKVTSEHVPERIRISVGTAMVLGLLCTKLDALPTTAYLMTYSEGKCSANCGFCTQAKDSSSRADMLSRVSWPIFSTNPVIDGIQKAHKQGVIKRVCIQAINYPSVFMHLQALVKTIYENTKVPISVSCQPLNKKNMTLLAEAGVQRLGIPLDAATEELFDKIKGERAGGPYNLKDQLELLREAVDIFGEARVSTHLIVGLGETEKEMIHIIQNCVDMKVLPALFAFTPINGTALEDKTQPSIQSYRRIQIARDLIREGFARFEKIRFNKEGQITDFGVEKQTVMRIIQTGNPFLTSGCPNCNRPYYNEKPSGPIYNYPRNLTEKELSEIRSTLDSEEALTDG